MSSRKLSLLLAVFCSVGPVLAQRSAIAPLAPVASSIAAPSHGVVISSRPSARLAAPVPDQPSRAVRPQPVFLINSRLIVGGGLAQVSPQDIASVYVYKGADAPAKWRGLTTNGIIAITLKPHVKPKLKTMALATIGRRLKLRGPISYQLDGLPLEDLALRVATTDIAGFDTQQTAGGTVVNIRLVVLPHIAHPPGTILIRGVSSL